MAPVDFFDKILNYYRKDANKDRPVISTSLAALLSIGFTLFYVIPLYFSSRTRPSPQLSRDAPAVIRARIRAVAITTIWSTVITILIAINKAHTSLGQTLQLLGWWPIDPVDIARVFALVVILFVGPLYEACVVDGEWRSWFSGRGFAETFSTAIGWRNYVASPVTEELVFRSLILPLHVLALPPSSLHPADPAPNDPNTPPSDRVTHPAVIQLIFVTPLYFGLAHAHHLYEFRVSHPQAPLLQGILRSLFQFMYTTIFGWFAAFVFLRTGSLWACILVHAFCNWRGLPRLRGRLGPLVDETTLLGADAPAAAGAQDSNLRGKEDDETKPIERRGTMSKERREKPLSLFWSIVYYVLLVVGAAGFYWYLWPLTDSKHALVSFGTPPVARGKAEVAKAVAKGVEAGARKAKELKGDTQIHGMKFWG
ncbi:MAG: hypothetical protein Q9159_005102 [Coniocarpon cinnabarinum]